MKPLYECLDNVLNALVEDKKETIHHFALTENGDIVVSENYTKAFGESGLDDKEIPDLLDILQKHEYVVYEKIDLTSTFLDVLDLKTGNHTTLKRENDKKITLLILHHSIELSWVGLTLKGKFHQMQGGYQGEEKAKNRDKDRIVKHDAQIRLLTYVIALGTAVAAAYYIWCVWTFYHPVFVREYFPAFY